MDFILYNKASMIQRKGGFAAFLQRQEKTNKQAFLNLAVFNMLKHDTGQTRRCACETGILLILPLPAVHIAVAGADGVGGNARSWAIVAKAGMKQADAPQEIARPCTSPQINDTSRAKGKFIPMRLYTFMCVGSRVIEAVGWRGILLHGGPHEQFIVMIETKKDGLGVSCFAKLNKQTAASHSLSLQTPDFKRFAAQKF